MTNTKPEQVPEKIKPSLSSLGALAEKHDTHEKAIKALSAAQIEITDIKDARREERIGWIVVSVILFDCLFLLSAENWSGPIVIGVLEIGMLAVAAKRLGVEEFHALFMGALNRFGGMIMGKDEE